MLDLVHGFGRLNPVGCQLHQTDSKMTDIAGQIAFDTGSIPRHIRRNPDPGGSVPHASLSGPISHTNDRGAIAIKGEPSFAGSPDAASVARRVLDAYFSKGVAVLDDIRGPFALLILEPSTRKCLIAIDRMGVERLTWGRNKGWISVGSSASDVVRQLTQTPELNPQALFNFMYSHMVPSPDTVFQNVFKLLPGTAIEFSANGHREFRFWQPDFSRNEKVDIDELREDTRPILRKAIQRSNPGRTSASFLSGGLDSSTVTGLLADVQSEQTRAFSVGFGVDEYDEMEFARAAAKHFDCSHFIYEVKPRDIVELVPKIVTAYDEPFGNSSVVPTLCCARFALEHGVDHLLAGDAGDELFGGNERYVRHRIFESYNRVPNWLKSTVLGPLARKIDPETGIYPLRKVSSYIRQAQIPLPERYESWNLIYREGADRIFANDFLKSVNPGRVFEEMHDVWQSCPSDDLLDRMLWYDWKVTLADNDLRKVSRMCELAGVRVSYPMLDEDFVALSMKVPSNEKIKGYELRTFFKNAVRGFVPDIVINKTKHGFGLPFGVWLKSNRPLQDLVYGSLDSLRHRDIFDLTFLDRVVAEHKSGHASYYGYAIWDLVMLEQWLEHHVP
jgi:asparagine synthase (glutamine-hydrolysing)